MGPVTYMIAILGCADGSAACQQVALMPARYESQAVCSAATNAALASSTEFDFPTIVAECRASKTSASVRKEAPRNSAQIASRQG